MTETSNLHLKKPAGEDFYNVGDFNENAEILDAAYKDLTNAQANLSNELKGKAPDNHTHTPDSIGAATAEQGNKADSAVQAIMIGGIEQSKAGGVVNLPAYPTTLPANGGNADTVDGKHASDFTLSYIRNNKPLVTSILPLEKTARLTWLPVDGATAYAVYLYIDGKYVTQSTSITNTYYDIQGLTPGTVYLALVRACVNDSWSSFNTDDLVHFYTLPVASATSDGLVTRSSQTFAGYKTFQNNVYIQHSEYTKSSTAPSTTQFKAYRFSDNANKQMGEFSNYVDTNNNTVSKMLAIAATSLDGKIYSQIATLINADGTSCRHVCTTPAVGASSLRQMASGTAAANTSNCPDGAWYGQYEEV